mmetsp:Transcript_19652/g.55518  ORF Transcript_19652/g.55518 Transcript_19652/m.55518 type:complete len:2329 (-) Transcript_19652:33-7019(-)|eukprot:CAMPEP_0119561952 /NCGR_PEP_ID=MMETSP1352-20130426/19088_1 /TAXON_ID=265584 /ORGANISM="Stauroneis constricta, Strain CCMP1120" /LENGTH=2328 /DNA_ID=CAMNT_0007610269 /DNA_START=365 /DNA_END=7351 /DNA_ORIENTATION=-
MASPAEPMEVSTDPNNSNGMARTSSIDPYLASIIEYVQSPATDDIFGHEEDTTVFRKESSHAFHNNLPSHHYESDDATTSSPLISKYAHQKSRYILNTVKSLELHESMFSSSTTTTSTSSNQNDDLSEFTKKCNRLQSQMNALENLKYSGFTRYHLSWIVLKLLKLVTATLQEGKDQEITLQYENVGYISTTTTTTSSNEKRSTLNELEIKLQNQPFALPSPAREVLLSILINILSNKGPLRSVSNAAIFPDRNDDNDDNNANDDESRFMLIIHWKVLLTMLLRTAPYLNERKTGTAPTSSNTRQNTILKRTVHLIRDARHFFEQGIRPSNASAGSVSASTSIPIDSTAQQIWEMVRTDIMYHSHTHASYRSLVIFYLFQPTRCSPGFYLNVLPDWLESWSNIDRCPEIDFLWLALFCRARKHLPHDYDWGPIRRRLLTHAQYWLLLPIGGAALDKSFPRVSAPRSRSCSARLKALTGSSSSYEEGIDFVAKVTKLLTIGLGTGRIRDEDGVSEGTADVLRFLSFVTPYFNPSNIGTWTFTLGAFLHYFSYELCCRVGTTSSMRCFEESNPNLYQALRNVEPSLVGTKIPSNELVLLLDMLLPLCQQSLYSKNAHVGRAGEASMLYFAQIDPSRVTPSFMDFAIRALDISAVNLAHQAPAALSALTRLLQPALRSNPAILMAKLPEMLRLSLAGIDSNDQNKTIRTLILYRSLTSWFPVGKPHSDGTDNNQKAPGGTKKLGDNLVDRLHESCNSQEYVDAVQQLPETSLLRQGVVDVDGMDLELLTEEASSAMCDWVLEFLDRIFALLRASGEREKAGKTSSRTAARHANVDVQQARNFSRVLRESLLQTFVAMDDTIHKSAVNAVVRFLAEETLPSAAKDAAYLCEAVASARPTTVGSSSTSNGNSGIVSPGLKAMLPILVDDLQHCPTKTCIYRLRCLAGAVRSCGHDILLYKSKISNAIKFALQSKDKHLYKTGCKLLRHTLAALCESRPVSYDIRPQLTFGSEGKLVYGRSAQLEGNPVTWHVPKTESIDFAWELIKTNIYDNLQSLLRSTTLMDSSELRRVLRVIRYTLRGAAGVLLDADTGADILEQQQQLQSSSSSSSSNENDDDEMKDVSLFPYEQAMRALLTTISADKLQSIVETRGRIAFLITKLVSLIASETFKLTDVQPSNDGASSGEDGDAIDTSEANVDMDTGGSEKDDIAIQISRDTKICKEITDISLLLLTRRGASFRSQEGKTIWKAQKQASTDFALLALADHAVESLQRSQLYGHNHVVHYKDGEDGGKTLPRRLLVNRVKLFHDSLQRSASFEVLRRLRRLSKLRQSSVNILFATNVTSTNLRDTMAELSGLALPLSMDLYEGLIDGLFSLCCHPNTQVRASSIGVVEYAITRFGWLVKSRVPRLLSAIRLEDGDCHGKFGVPSCSKLVEFKDIKGKRKRLSEALKGVCAILSTSRPSKQLLSDEAIRCEFIKTICGTDSLVALMPAEEMQKMVHYMHNIFSPFRMKFYSIPRATEMEQDLHEEALVYLLDTLSSSDKTATTTTDGGEEVEAKEVHWRKLLLSSYFLTVVVDSHDMRDPTSDIANRLWSTCFRILETEYGQPLQRVTLGLFGRLVMITPQLSLLRDQMVNASFCESLCKALVYDHKEDTSIGGGHDAQWSTGVADFIRDSARNIAPKTLFPFQRTNQRSGTFKVSHAQLVERILQSMPADDALTASRHLMEYSKTLASAPPSEDQRNQQCTVAEIFAGICKSTLQHPDLDQLNQIWSSDLLPFLDDVYPKIPTSLSGAFFDSVRFSLQFSSPDRFYPMTEWLFSKVDETLWQPSQADAEGTNGSSQDDGGAANGGSEQGAEGFAAQSKWLYLCSALLVELDEMEVDTMGPTTAWYSSALATMPEDGKIESGVKENLQRSWALVREKLLPKLASALGHPYENCRDHIAGCLFRICHCHRKMARETASRNASRAPSRSNSSGNFEQMIAEFSSQDPGIFIVEKLLALRTSDERSYKIRFNSLHTVRKFFSYCIYLGEAKHEFSDYLITLLPLAFEALKTSSTEDNDESAADSTDVAKRSMESDIVKGYRFTIAEISVASVISYDSSRDISRVLDTVAQVTSHESWQVRHAAAHFLRCFQGGHKYVFTDAQEELVTNLIASMLADERREVSSAAMAAITGILAALPVGTVARLVKKYAVQANKSKMKRKKNAKKAPLANTEATTQPANGSNAGADDSDEQQRLAEREKKRSKTQQTSVYFLCAAVLAQPYETPEYVPVALAAISKHSFERNAPLSVRETVKKCCAEYKRTHMSDNWEIHRRVFTQEQLEALEDVVSSPHYYA